MLKFAETSARILAVGLLMAFAGFAAAQQAYPSKPIRFIVPYAPGGGVDIIARLIGQKLTESWGQQVLVDNRPGAGTVIGSEALVKSPPDGYTIMLAANTHAINANVLALPYDSVKDFTLVSTVTRSENLLVVSPSVPVNNLQEFIALAKARPGQLNYGSTGTGGPNHLAGALFEMMTGTRLQHVPYKGSAQVLPDLIGGQIQLAFMNPINAISHTRKGQLKAIAISGETRSPALPQVPTFTEGGLPGFEVRTWYGIFAPARTPREIVDKLAAELASIMVKPDIREKLANQGSEPFVTPPDQFLDLLKADIARFGKLIKAANIKLEN